MPYISPWAQWNCECCRHRYGYSTTTTSWTSPRLFHSWREAIDYATKHAQWKPTVKRQVFGDKWVVTFRKPVYAATFNGATA